MSLQALQDLFRRHREKATGHWKLGDEPYRLIYLDSGDIVFAHSTHPQDRLTHLLVERGKLTQAQLDYAMANLKPGLSIGKNLIDMGFITQRDLLETARAQVERVVAAALATPDLKPTFEARELDAAVVRLPFDTPALLLHVLLGLRDRERILELLGPLNQVVVLQGRALQTLGLPSDLAKLPALLDGTHTLLELSREASVEPLRLGAFALFLREMGWARLHEMPPVDRRALDMALTPEPEPLAAPLPEPPLDTMPTLFATIQDAARPTTNLEHLSQAFDALPGGESPDEPEARGLGVATGQALLPTPSLELPPLPEEPLEEADEGIPIRPATLGHDVTPPPSLLEPLDEAADTHRPRWKGIALLGAVLLVGLGGWYFVRRTPSGSPPAAVVTPSQGAESAREQPPVPEPVQPSASEPSKLEPVSNETSAGTEPPLAFGVEDRCRTLRKGDLERAVRQGQAFRQAQKPGTWTLRLEIACQAETLQKAVGLFQDKDPDLWILPMSLRDGRGCYQLFWGAYPNRAAALRQVARVPSAFRAEGNRPKPFRLEDLSERQ